jgi:hypothetical protein
VRPSLAVIFFDNVNNVGVTGIPLSNHPGKVLVTHVAVGYTHDYEGAKTTWRTLPESERYIYDWSARPLTDAKELQ